MSAFAERPVGLVVISAGLSVPSSTRLLADRLSDATAAVLAHQGDSAEVQVVELREWARDLTDHLLTGFPNERLRAVLAEVAAADGVIAVTPIFSASYSGLFKLFFDVLDPEALQGKPVLVAATGGSVRHSLALEYALRPLFTYLRAQLVPTAVFAATEDWASDGELRTRVDRAARELAQLIAPEGSTLGRVERRSDGGDQDGAHAEPIELIPFTRLLAAQQAAAVSQAR
jgi:FMN reductase